MDMRTHGAAEERLARPCGYVAQHWTPRSPAVLHADAGARTPAPGGCADVPVGHADGGTSMGKGKGGDTYKHHCLRESV